MGKTISTHNGSQAHRAHNIRDPKATGKQEHINPALSGNNETIVDISPQEAYTALFGGALEEYNLKQSKRPERQISDYLGHIRKDKKKHAVYEMIIQVGDRNDTGINPEETQTERRILKEFIAGWPERNQCLALIGAYIHADETDGTLHAHLDYIPVASGYKNGMRLQNGLVRALGAQGFEMKRVNGETAQIRWEKRENGVLEQICNKYGIEVEHPREGRKHEHTSTYKLGKAEEERKLTQLKTEIASRASERLKFARESVQMRNDLSNLDARQRGLKRKIEGVESEIEIKQAKSKKLEAEISEKERRYLSLGVNVSELEERAKRLEGRILTQNEVINIKTKGIFGKREIVEVGKSEFLSLQTTAMYANERENEAQKAKNERNEALKFARKAEETLKELKTRESRLISREKRLSEKEISLSQKENTLERRERAVKAGEKEIESAYTKRLEQFAAGVKYKDSRSVFDDFETEEAKRTRSYTYGISR